VKRTAIATMALAATLGLTGGASAKYKVFTVTMVGFCDVFQVKQYTRAFITVSPDPSSCDAFLGLGEIGKTNLSGSVATAGVVMNGDASNPLYLEMTFPLKGGVIQFFRLGPHGDPEQTMATAYTIERTRLKGPRSGQSLSSLLNR